MTHPIPHPPRLPLLGNIHQMDPVQPIKGFADLAKTYGEIYSFRILGKELFVVSSYALQNELSDDKRFIKNPDANVVMTQLKTLVGKGLFTSTVDAPEWGVAHRLLLPAFGPSAIRGMFPDMLDIASQLVLKWERFGADHVINPCEDFTRLTFDTIALCSMSHRLNSFYSDTEPPFIKAMSNWLLECSERPKRPPFLQWFMFWSNAKFQQDINLMTDLAAKIVAKRRAEPTDKKDLLNLMLNGRDPKTGEGMSDENIIHNFLTFLIAGHETTSGLLSFALYYLLKSPDAMAKLRAEVDEVISKAPLEVGHLSKLPYATAVLRETLRLTPPIPVRAVSSKEDTTLLGGKYAIEAGSELLVLLNVTHFEREVWGEDADEFKPERMLNGRFAALPPNAWQPFGHGSRACIGRAFAWQEVMMALALVIQRFDLTMVDPSYTLSIKFTVTVKPEGFLIHAKPRSGWDQAPEALSSLPTRKEMASPISPPVAVEKTTAPDAPCVYVFYGSNSGSAETFAQRIALDAPSHGFRSKVDVLDKATRRMPVNGPVVIITATYEGEPPDNATQFVQWISEIESNGVAGVKYAVFGCGHQDWVKSYQRIPTLCDEMLERGGAQRLVPRGVGDASGATFFEAFDKFETELWECLKQECCTAGPSYIQELTVETVDLGVPRAITLRQAGTTFGEVVENTVLTSLGVPVKRHIVIQLPDGVSYRAGDYLAILPVNPARDVKRVLSRFRLSEETEVIISSGGPTLLPVNKPVHLLTVLKGYVELSQPATTRDLRVLLQLSASEATHDALKTLHDNHASRVLSARLSVLDILELYCDIEILLGAFLDMLPSMRTRQYSISSSPLAKVGQLTLTMSVLDAPAMSGRNLPFLGVASNFLNTLTSGDRVQIAIRSSRFHLPDDPTVPVVMICAGSGVAPFRGFMQERAAQKAGGMAIGRMMLFFGCHSPEQDYLYGKTDLERWSKQGVVDIRMAFSQASSDSHDCKYVQHCLQYNKRDVLSAFHEGAKFYVCGSRSMAADVRDVLLGIIKEAHNNSDDDGQARQWFERCMQGRYATDIFE